MDKISAENIPDCSACGPFQRIVEVSEIEWLLKITLIPLKAQQHFWFLFMPCPSKEAIGCGNMTVNLPKFQSASCE
jgi:hypothetical protein